LRPGGIQTDYFATQAEVMTTAPRRKIFIGSLLIA
jgi:hypothetical protein